MGKDLGGPATEPEVAEAADGDETLIGDRLLLASHERTGMRRTAGSVPDSIEVDVGPEESERHEDALPETEGEPYDFDLSRTHSSEVPIFSLAEPRRNAPHAAILAPADEVDAERESDPGDYRAHDDVLIDDETSAWRAPPRPDPCELIGRVVAGRYLLGPVLGAGGMGTVFQAEHTDLGKQVAIKVLAAVLDAHHEAKARFLREAKAASTIESEHIAQVFDIGEDFHLGLYMVMELLKGEDLASLLASQGALSPELSAGIVWQVCLALERAHAAGVVHRDLKPANVFLTRGDDGSIKVKVVDFGIAKLLRDARRSRRGAITQRGFVVGTPQYMSPEQAQGLATVDHRTDMYSVGALLFECISGVPPYPELESHELTLYKLLSEPPPRLSSRVPGISPALDALVAELMTRNPDERPVSAGIVRARLGAIFPSLGRRTLVLGDSAPVSPAVAVVPRTGSGVTVDSQRDGETVPPAARRSKPALGIVAAALAMTVAGVGFLMARGHGASSDAGEPTTLTAGQELAQGPSSAAGRAPAPPLTGVRVLVAAEEEGAELVRRAQQALERGDLEHARQLATDAVRRAPSNAEGWLTLGAAHEALGDGAAARTAYTSCKEQATGERARECAALLDR